jgi:hypothetical protein
MDDVVAMLTARLRRIHGCGRVASDRGDRASGTDEVEGTQGLAYAAGVNRSEAAGGR